MEKILLAEPVDKAGLKLLEGRFEVVVSPNPSGQFVGQLLGDADGLIVRTATKVTRSMIEKAKRLKVISRTGGGVDNVDVAAATERNVVVCGVKGPQDRYVAEHAIALMICLAKQLFYLDKEVRTGNFRARYEYCPVGIAGKNVGLIGIGRIGRLVAKFCKDLGMEVMEYDPYICSEELEKSGILACKNMKDVIQNADFLSIHVPLSNETRGLIGKEELSWMKPTAFVINTSRGEVIEEKALIHALKNGVIAGAGIDVFEKEPPDRLHPLFELENVILTPHSASLTKDAVAKLAKVAAQNVIDVLEGRKPSYSVNWEEVEKRRSQMKTH